ncbi:TPA: hypothetical protein ACVAAY_008001, partial [Burkholderia contaminans]
GHLIAKVAMDPRSKLVRIDRELEMYLALPPAEAARLIEKAYQIAPNRQEFVAALIGKVLTYREFFEASRR